MITTSAVAQEPFCVATLPGWLQWQGNQGHYGRRAPTYGDHLRAELHFRRFPLGIYGVAPITGNGGVYWVRSGDSPPSLRDYRTCQPMPEDKRGETLSYYVAAFSKLIPEKLLVAILSFGDAGVNENRGLLTPQTLLWVPHSICKLAEPRLWMVCWKTGFITVERFCVEGEVRNNQPLPVPLSFRRPHEDNMLPHIRWALTGLSVVVDGRPNEEVVWQLDDDLRHLFDTPRSENGLYIMESALLKARAKGWCPSTPLEVDLSPYGDIATTIHVLVRSGYQQVSATPRRPSEFQIIAGDRILCWPKEAGYAVSIFGLCRDGSSLGSFVAQAQPTERGYFGPSVSAQIRMVAPYFSYAFMLDEGLDPTCYDLCVPPDEFPVRGQAGGRLSSVLCLYEEM